MNPEITTRTQDLLRNEQLIEQGHQAIARVNRAVEELQEWIKKTETYLER